MHPGTMLTDAIRQWRTPDAPNAGGPRNRQTSVGHGHQVTIAEQAEHWPTPNVPNGGRTGSTSNYDDQGRKRQIDLGAVAPLWRTPTVGTPNSMRGSGQDADVREEQGHTVNLQDQVRLWKTPHGFANTDQFGRTGGGGGEFHKQAMSWSTPRVACNVTGATTRLPFADGGKTSKPSLEDQAREMWPTPAAEPYGSSQNGINGKGGAHERPSANTPSLDRLSRSFLPLLQTSTHGDASSPSDPTSRRRWPSPTVMDSAGFHGQPDTGRTSVNSGQTLAGATEGPARKAKLNPQFVEWLMGFPIGWTDSVLAATEWCRWRQRMRSSLYALVRSTGLE
jgi:hypothetical protein